MANCFPRSWSNWTRPPWIQPSCSAAWSSSPPTRGATRCSPSRASRITSCSGPLPIRACISNITRVISFGVAMPFMLAGVIMVLWPNKMKFADWLARRETLLVLFLAVYAGIHILTWTLVRYRLPVDAVLLPVAAYSLTRLAQKIWPRLGAAAMKILAIVPYVPDLVRVRPYQFLRHLVLAGHEVRLLTVGSSLADGRGRGGI